MSDPIITIQDLTKHYDSVTAVDGLTLTIGKGEVFGLCGPNGAGKTTTILMLLGLSEPSSGTAFVSGIDCTRNPLRVKKLVGYLPDNAGFYPDMTGRENLRFTGAMNGLSGQVLEERIAQLLRRTGMEEAADRKTSTYSKGMKQRLGIADILVKDPDVLILDEPTNGIDPQGMRELMQLIRELAEKDGKTILISSHQLYQIQQICDRVGIFVKGKLIACGKIDELGRQMGGKHGFTLEVKAAPANSRGMQLLLSLPGVENAELEEGMWTIRSDRDVSGEAVRLLVENGFRITHVRQRSGDLDEIYAQYFEEAGDIRATQTSGKQRKAADSLRSSVS